MSRHQCRKRVDNPGITVVREFDPRRAGVKKEKATGTVVQ